VSTYFLRDTTENPSLLKSIIGAVLPLALKRHLLYVKHYKRVGNFRNPQLFSEKMQWRIINDRREILRHTCDKRASKRLALEAGAAAGVEINTPRQLAWSPTSDGAISALRQLHASGTLPNCWVMKPNHSSGRALAIEGTPDWTMIEEAARAWLAPSRFAGLHWIWPYVTAEVGLLAEEFIPGDQPPIEWQLWIMSGRIEFVVVQQRIGDRPNRSAFDRRWRRMTPWYKRAAAPLDVNIPPQNWETIERVALTLGSQWDLIRVDLFEDQRGAIWFSELTPYPSEGLFPDNDGLRTFDEAAGAAWSLPTLSKGERSGG
jgi:hypothetical protein